MAQPVFGLPSIALRRGNSFWLKSAEAALRLSGLADNASPAGPAEIRASVSTMLPFSERPGPLPGKLSSASASSRIAVTPARSVLAVIVYVSVGGLGPLKR